MRPLSSLSPVPTCYPVGRLPDPPEQLATAVPHNSSVWRNARWYDIRWMELVSPPPMPHVISLPPHGVCGYKVP